jgi:hypothetical protein
MERRYNIEEIESLLGKKSENPEENSKINEFFQLLLKSKQPSGDPCPDSDDDCSDLLSSCCDAILTTVFGTLPLEVECSSCKKLYFLKDILEEEKIS